MIFSIAMGADYSFYVKSIATFALTFFGYIISVLASVWIETALKILSKAHNSFSKYFVLFTLLCKSEGL